MSPAMFLQRSSRQNPHSLSIHGSLTRYLKLWVAHEPGFFSATDLKKNPLVSDPRTHHGTCISHLPWCMSGSPTRGGKRPMGSCKRVPYLTTLNKKSRNTDQNMYGFSYDAGVNHKENNWVPPAKKVHNGRYRGSIVLVISPDYHTSAVKYSRTYIDLSGWYVLHQKLRLKRLIFLVHTIQRCNTVLPKISTRPIWPNSILCSLTKQSLQPEVNNGFLFINDITLSYVVQLV